MSKFSGQNLLAFLFFIFTVTAFTQERDITPYLKMIEEGQKDSVLKILPDLKSSYPDDPSVLYLDGILQENGQDAVPVFNRIIKDFPKSKYADASFYRLYSYYYSLGLYNTAAVFLNGLKKGYPNSPYIKLSAKEIPSTNETESAPPINNSIPEGNISNFKFTIQAGAFSNDSNAIALKKSLTTSGYYSYIKKKSVAGSDFSVVYVGQFNSHDEAESFLQVLNKKFELNGHIVSVN